MISRILYYIFIVPISLLPYSILYFFSDILYFIIYKIIKYRKNVVYTNLKNSFPEKSTKEVKEIMQKFYHHFCDVIVESCKGFTISEKELSKRVNIKNPELSNFYAKNDQNIIFIAGHYNNWEICAQACPIYSMHQCIGIYKPLKEKFLNDKINLSRSKYGLRLISMLQVKKYFKEENQPKAIIFSTDQNPASVKNAYWLDFLNQDTAVLFGAEKYAVEYNCPVIYASINKVKRGFYEVEYSLVTDNPKEKKYGDITKDFTKRLENDIINQPQYWLWSHKRWKHKR